MLYPAELRARAAPEVARFPGQRNRLRFEGKSREAPADNGAYTPRMNISAMIFGLIALSTQLPPAQDQPFWAWSQGSAVSVVEIDLIRANVQVVRRDGPVEIRIVRMIRSGRASEVKIVALDKNGILTVQDRYPSDAFAQGYECLSPLDERGDFWHNDVRFDATVWAPPATRVTARVMEGKVEGDR